MSQETVISNLKNLIMGSSTVSFSDQTIEGSITLDSQQKNQFNRIFDERR